jgi:regulator of replication initiation timing
MSNTPNTPSIDPMQNWKAMYESMANMHRHQNQRLQEIRMDNHRLKIENAELKAALAGSARSKGVQS